MKRERERERDIIFEILSVRQKQRLGGEREESECQCVLEAEIY